MTENEKLRRAIEEEKELYEIAKERYEKLGVKNCKDRAEEHNMMVKWLEEIQQYRDAEEQGLLLRLPCPIGTKLYGFETQFWIDKKGCKECVYYCDCDEDSFCDYTEECPACTKIIETAFKLELLEKIGKSLFLTKEEAERALKQMGEV